MNLSDFGEFVRECYGPFLPASKIKKERFLEKVRDKVDYYKPRIEERFGVDMGKVEVKDSKYLVEDIIKALREEDFNKISERTGREISLVEKGLVYSYTIPAKIIMTPINCMLQNFLGAEMKYENSSIYVPFYFQNRFMDIDFERREKGLDQTVVHELSHHLWHVLGGQENTDSILGLGNWSIWSEGFATYCADIHLSDLYPENAEINMDYPKLYITGRNKIKKVIEDNGKDILLEVPKRWNEFNDNNS